MRCKNADRSSGLVTHLARGGFRPDRGKHNSFDPTQFGDGRPYRPANLHGPFMEIVSTVSRTFFLIRPQAGFLRPPIAWLTLFGRLKQHKECSIAKGHSVKGRHIDRDDN
jgi:hypothetical protein